LITHSYERGGRRKGRPGRTDGFAARFALHKNPNRLGWKFSVSVNA